ncbi:hybrid sensor histidine kinase/response regulator [Marinagarivorans algicola]|uniref:hybrid sensor histidine kinase/response regulator n=1 Tax=Marinagarivorans algicola TaxID=1513270 RepID=UPI0009E8390C|nr:two-component regulator propeller domain-containing protein [Marinagarivorans algicola]
MRLFAASLLATFHLLCGLMAIAQPITAFASARLAQAPPKQGNMKPADIDFSGHNHPAGTKLEPLDQTNTIKLDTIRFKRLLQGTDSDEVINAIYVTRQDPYGFIWFGGEHGLARYDGHDIKIYQHNANNPSSLTSNAIWDIVFDHDGVMWLATDAGLGRYNAASDDFTSFRSKGLTANSITGDSVRALAVDSHNNLLIGTDNGFNILDADRRNYQSFTDRPEDPYRLPSAAIHAVYSEANGDIWLGTTESGLIKLQRKPFAIEVFAHNPAQPSTIGHNRITDIIRDHTGALWVSSFGGGISRMNADAKTFTNYRNDPNNAHSLGSNTVWNIFEDSLNNLWVATDHGGLARYNYATDDFSHIKHNPYDTSSLSSNNIRSVFEDKQGDLWIGAFPIGTNFFDRSSTVFQNYAHLPHQATSLSHSTLLTIQKSQQGHLWIGTEGGINAFNTHTHQSRRYTAKPGQAGHLQSNAVLSIAEAQNGDLWVGTWSGGLHKLDTSSNTFTQFLPDAANLANPNTVNSAYIWSLLIDKDKNLWIGTETGGLNFLETKTGKFKHYVSSDPATAHHVSNAHVWTLLEDSSGAIWAGTLHGLNKFNKDTQTFEHYFSDPSNPQTLSNNRVISLLEDTQKQLWVGTQGGGISILDPARKYFNHITLKDGLPSSNVASMVQAPDGKVWATTDKGVVSIELNTHAASGSMPSQSNHGPHSQAKYLIKHYQKSHGLIGNNFNRDATYIDEDGLLYLGSTEGLSIVDVNKINTHTSPPQAVFTDLKIFNESVTGLAEGSPLKDAIYKTNAIELDYSQRVFSVSFSALSYRSANRNQYAYLLEGFDKKWNDVGNKHTANYTNISPGKYTLKVKAANAAGVWSTTNSELKITIKAPYWQTWWAYSVYMFVLFVFIWAYTRQKAKRVELQQEREVNAQLVKIDKMKDSFLANTSHELRTPLNGIIGLAESLRDSCCDELEAAKISQLNMIVSSGKRLSHLINDILDLSKLADRQIELKLQPVDLRYLTDTVITLLAPLTNNKPIKLQNEIPNPFYAVEADENRLQQIMFNLIGNAIKYSDQGYVKINAQQDDATTTIRVKDTGIGIAPEDLKTIFQSFCQLEHTDAREHGGTGLGLAITKQLVELHGGKMDVISQPGKGTTFIFTMPTSKTLSQSDKHKKIEVPPPTDIFTASKSKVVTVQGSVRSTLDDTLNNSQENSQDNSQHNTQGTLQNNTHQNNTQQNNIQKHTLDTRSDKQSSGAVHHKKSDKNTAKSKLKVQPLKTRCPLTILSVDDDPVNRMVLKGILKLHDYNVIEADNGETALQKIAEHPEIDLVVLDVMMPKMTGYEACEILRKEHPLYELPVIFLTAKDVESELTQGFLSGGNDFVSKPVKKEELLARIKAQLTMLLHARSLANNVNSEAVYNPALK